MINLNLKDKENIAFIGDLHADSKGHSSRIDNIYDVLDMKLNSILDTCKKENVKYIFFEGDIFNRVSCTHEIVNFIGKKFIEFNLNGIKLFTIVGNHDMLRNSLDGFSKSPLYTLISFNIIKHINLDNKVSINDNILITPVDYTEYPEKADTENYNLNILLAHMFYNVSELLSDKNHNISPENVREWGYDYIFLGHDHEDYKTLKLNTSYIVRTGSVIRGTSHSYNFTKVPKFTIVKNLYEFSETKDKKCIVLDYPVIKHADFDSIVSEEVKRKNNKGFTISGIRDMLNDLANKLADDKHDSDDIIYEIIKNDENIPPKNKNIIFKYINEI